MAPKRRSGTRRAAAAPPPQQSTLSFHGKAGAITKSNRGDDAKANKKDPAILEDVVTSDITIDASPSVDESTTAAAAVQQQTRPVVSELTTTDEPHPAEATADPSVATVEDVLGGRAEPSDAGAVEGPSGTGWLGDEEIRARKVTDAQIKRYWRDKEAQRLAPRVHQEDLSVYEKVLREWDMSGQYGPCIGIARMKRWKRANTLGLNPPIEILAVLLKDVDAGDTKSQRAHVDELLSSRYIET